MQRLVLVDGFRGFFLMFMGVAHFNGILRTEIGKINHLHFGWVEDAQGFVFISGMIVALVYGGRFLKSGDPAALRRQIWARIRTIYAHQTTLILILLAAALTLGAGAPRYFAPYQEAPALFTATSLMLVSASAHMGILPMYIFFLMVTPWVLRMLAGGQAAVVAGLMVLSWLFAQTGVVELVMGWIEVAGATRGWALNLGIYFNVFAWQLLFFSGLCIGWRMAKGDFAMEFLREEQYRNLFLILAVTVVALGIFDRAVEWDLLGAAFSDGFEARTDRGWLSFVYPLAFLVDLYVVFWLVNAGPSDRWLAIRIAARALLAVFTSRPLVMLGQHSLHVFSYHLLLFYALAVVVPIIEPSAGERVAILIAAVASLWLAARGHAWLVARDRARDRSRGRAGAVTPPA
jgi:hypothetical protein